MNRNYIFISTGSGGVEIRSPAGKSDPIPGRPIDICVTEDIVIIVYDWSLAEAQKNKFLFDDVDRNVFAYTKQGKELWRIYFPSTFDCRGPVGSIARIEGDTIWLLTLDDFRVQVALSSGQVVSAEYYGRG